jgi:hypothetical protein
MQTLEHNQMGLAPMTEVEMQEIEGGGFWKWYCIIAAALHVVGICIVTAGLGLVAAATANVIALSGGTLMKAGYLGGGI